MNNMYVDLNDESTIRSLMKGKVSDDYKEELKETFALFDADQDGRVTTKEISTIMRSLGMVISDVKMEELMARLDTDGNGTVEYQEFEDFMLTSEHVSHMTDETDEDMINAFMILDRDGDGFIDREELKYYMTKFGDKMSDQDADELIKMADTNGDGKIDYKEYAKHMQEQL